MNVHTFKDYSKRLTPADRKLVVAVLVSGLVLWTVFWSPREPGRRVVVKVLGQVVKTVELDENQIIRVTGQRGVSIIQVKDNRVRFLESACPHQFCVHQGAIRHGGDIVVCIPNRVVVHILKQNKHSFDVITG